MPLGKTSGSQKENTEQEKTDWESVLYNQLSNRYHLEMARHMSTSPSQHFSQTFTDFFSRVLFCTSQSSFMPPEE